jgi:peptidoglycan/LPS O-acetylase OafA/YrhL
MQTSIRTNVVVELAVAAILIVSPFLLVLLPSQGKASRLAASVMLVMSVAVLVFVALMSDAVFGISASWIFTLVVWAIGFGVCVAVRVRYRSILSLVVAFLLTLFILVLHFVDVLPVKPYKRFFTAIRPGMTDPEIMALLHREFPDGGRFPVPVRYDFRTNEISFALDPKESAWNAEAIVLYLESGRVVRKEYSRD